MFLSSAFIVLSFLLFVLFSIKTKRQNYLLSKIPSPKKYFLLHNLPEGFGLDRTELFKKIQDHSHKLGDIFHVTFHPLDCGVLFVGDHEIAQTLSTSQPYRTRAMAYRFLSGWVGSDGGFLGGGNQQKEKLKLLKRIMTPEFHQKYLNLVSSHIETGLKEVNIKQIKQIEFHSWISNVILDISFGEVLNHISRAANFKAYINKIGKTEKLAALHISGLKMLK
jgi:hypothetical protein